MSNISFTLKERYHTNISLNNPNTFDDYVNRTLLKLSEKEYLIETSIYLADVRVSESTQKICDFFDQADIESKKVKCSPMFGGKFVNLDITRSSKITKWLNENELNDTIIKYLSDNNFYRGCWICGNMNVNVKNKFIDYGTEYISYTNHQKCVEKDCDLIVYEHSCAGRIKILQRFNDYILKLSGFYFDGSNNEIVLTLPPICNRHKIIDTFLNSYHDKKLQYEDFDVYFVGIKREHKKSKKSKKSEKNVICINNNDEFVLETCRINDSYEYELQSDYETYKYFIVCKIILFCQFVLLNDNLPDCLSKIIYEYVNFESIEPDL